MSAINGVKKAITDKDWRWLAAFFLYAAVALLIVSAITFNSLVESLKSFGVLRDNIYAPQRYLQYSDKQETQNAEGKYVTTFTIKISSPPGYLGEMVLYTKPNGCDDQTKERITTGAIEFKNGTMYVVDEHRITCTTDEPITESRNGGLLFELVE